MGVQFTIIPEEDMSIIVPLLDQLNEGRISEDILLQRTQEMAQQNYECIGIWEVDLLIGICGMWFQTRHYAGKSLEVDHVFIQENFRNKGIGDQLMNFVYDYAKSKKCNWVELNTYVENFPSHKFYNRQGFIARGYHFVKPLVE
ncbi:MAG: GNAT family N-acetyltransferase [Flavobacteriaceae bacterium]|nr:GNAT family N-acetyltransferase [Flavobacteriaceae bacterium]